MSLGREGSITLFLGLDGYSHLIKWWHIPRICPYFMNGGDPTSCTHRSWEWRDGRADLALCPLLCFTLPSGAPATRCAGICSTVPFKWIGPIALLKWLVPIAVPCTSGWLGVPRCSENLERDTALNFQDWWVQEVRPPPIINWWHIPAICYHFIR